MKERPNVIPLRRTATHSRRRGPLPRADRELRAGLRPVEAELERAKARAERPEGLLVTLARLAQAGTRGLSWASLARLQSALYFAWHSEDVDEFGSDRRFTETLQPLFEFLPTVWGRGENARSLHVPPQGSGRVRVD